MTLRWTLLTVLLLAATPLNAKTPARPRHHAKRAAKKVAPALTWRALAERVIKEGVDRPYTAPATRKLGYATDDVTAKAALYESSQTPDGEDHSIYITYVSTNGVLRPKDIIVDAVHIYKEKAVQRFEGHIIRFDLDGKIIAAIRATGIVGGDITQTVMPPKGKFAVSRLNRDRDLFLVEMAGKPFSQ
jgi:hypothetical protein